MRSLLPVILPLLIAGNAVAQVRESVTVEVVEVPVYVTAADGTPIRGLTKDAFALRVNGRPQPAEFFDAIDFASPHGAASPPTGSRDVRERRLYVLAFDRLHNKSMPRVQEAALRLIASSNRASDSFAIALFTATRGFEFLTPFLTDRVAIARAIATLEPSKAQDPLGLATLPDERAPSHIAELDTLKTDNVSQIAASGAREPMTTIETVRGGPANVAAMAEPARRVVEDEFDGLAAAAERLRTLDGQKHVILMSSGFDGLFTQTDSRYRRMLDELRRAFAAAGAFVDTIDTFPYASMNGGQTLRLMAEATGGSAMRGNDLANDLAQLTQGQEVVYVLGFHRRDAAGGSIDVRVSGLPRGARVAYRDGFGAAVKNASVDRLQLADILVNEIPQSGVRVALRAAPNGIEVVVPRADVVAQAGASAFVDVWLYVFDASGATAFVKSAKLPAGDEIALRVRPSLPAGKYVAKAVVQIESTPSTGFARSEFEVQ